MKPPADSDSARQLFEAHPRGFEGNRYVYPVVSRRAGGISIGVNLNLDKACNFDCVYCQVDRTEKGKPQTIDPAKLASELDDAIELVTSGRIFEHARFSQTPPQLRRLNDIALSGDGEPTTHRAFGEVVAACVDARRQHHLDDVKLVLITNASMFHRDWVRRALQTLDASGGQIWAKLDAGTEAYYRKIARSAIPLTRILDNLRWAACVRPIVIQSLFARIHGQPPPPDEQEAYCQRLNEIVTAGGRIKLVQLHTIARPPAESWVQPLSDAAVDRMADLVGRRTGLRIEAFYGS